MFGGGTSFGANNNTTTGGPMSSGFTFGNKTNTATNTGKGTSLFGQQSQPFGSASGGLFGSSKPSTFGTTTSTTTAGGGLFGSTNSTLTQATNNTTLGGGNTGLFGGKPATTTSTLGGGLFGAKPATNTTSTIGGSLFGTKPATNTTSTIGGGLFGTKPASTTTTTSTLGGGLFGTQQQPQPQTQPTLTSQPSFAWSRNNNNTTATNLITNQQQFPQQQQQQQQNSLSLLSQTNQPSIYALQQQQSTANYPQQIQEQILKCKESWDPTSFKSKLRAFVYNKVNETESMLYTKPPYIIQEEWDQAIENKPRGDYNVIPIQLNGFDDLNQRNQLQIESVAQIRLILKEMLDKNTQLQQKHELDTAARILKVQQRNVQIERRILKLGSQLAILRNKGLPMSINEEKMWTQFKNLLKRSEDPAGLGKTNELWARLSVLKERAKAISDQLDNTLIVISENGKVKKNTTSNGTNLNKNDKSTRVIDVITPSNSNQLGKESNDIDKIAHILSNQQRGILYLNSVIEKDNQTIDKITN